MSDCRFGVSPVNYPDPDREQNLTEAFGFFRQCGTVFYLVRYGAVRCIYLVTPVSY